MACLCHLAMNPMSADPPVSEELVRLDTVSVHFPMRKGRSGRGAVRALDGVDLSIREGEVLGIVGESGSGKSTLGRLLVGLTNPTHGTVVVRGVPRPTGLRPGADARKHGFQMVYQDPAGSLNPRMKVGASIGEALVNDALRGAEVSRRVAELLEDVGLAPAMADRYPDDLSGGQQQRVAIARALASNPRLIVLDEAVSSLDMSTQAQVLNLLKDIRERHRITYVFISHDLAAVEFISTRVVVMYLGRICEVADVDTMRLDPSHPYSICLKAAVPRVHGNEGPPELFVLGGTVPSALSPPSGCPFHTRCPIVQEGCSAQEPTLVELAPGHWVSCFHAGRFEQLLPEPSRNSRNIS